MKYVDKDKNILFPLNPVTPRTPCEPVGPITATLVPGVPADPVIFRAKLAVLMAIPAKLLMNDALVAVLALMANPIVVGGTLCG